MSNKKKKNSGRSTADIKKKFDEDIQVSEQIQHEIAGIIWIALGLLLALSMYVISRSPFGGAISSFIIGLVGTLGYLVPLALIYIGIRCFLHTKKPIRLYYHILVLIFCGLILMLINIKQLSSDDLGFFPYLGKAYMLGSTEFFSGGFIMAIISYPLEALCTSAGAYIIIFAGMLIVLLLIFRFSISEAIAEARERHRIAIEERRAREEEEDEYDDDRDYDDEEDEDVEDEDEVDDDIEEEESFGSFTSASFSNKKDSESIVNEPEEDDYVVPDDDGLSDDAFAVQTSYQRPPYTILQENTDSPVSGKEEAERQGKVLISALANFGIDISISHISIGPAVTRFEIQLAKGVRIRSITSLTADIALALAAESVRIEAPIPGKQAVGIEVPNKQPTYVFLRELLESPEFKDSQSVLSFAVGKDIVGKNIVADISKMPHLMIAGSTGSGKSVCMNTVILSLIYKSSPEDVRLILIDPKIVEFGIYSTLPHLLIPVVTDTKKAASALKWSVSEMSRRYSLFAKHKLRNIAEYNAYLPDDETRMPRIVIIIDELAELMMSSAKEVEEYITRIAQLGRACGIHLIVATQRPSVDIITGKIKANIVSRIAFAVSDATNSKVILDSTGAECLIGNGDMLFHPLGMAKPRRVQGAFVSSSEVEAVLNFFEEHDMQPVFDDFVDSQIEAGVTAEPLEDEEELDSVFVDAALLVIDSQRASISFIQQKLRLGYNRAARIMNAMETYGIVSTIDPVKKERTVTMTRAEFMARFVNKKDDGGESGSFSE